jgi:hypothetical protein
VDEAILDWKNLTGSTGKIMASNSSDVLLPWLLLVGATNW